ncbi:MAG: AAA family ATPase [Acidobacteriota bacterium]
MGVSITVVESTDRQLTMLARGAGLIVGASVPIGELAGVDRQGKPPDVLLVDLRGRTTLPTDLANLKRRHPRMGVVIVASQMDPAMMLEAMRAGVSEFVTDPVEAPDLKAAVDRVVGQHSAPTAPGQILAFLGAKGGVGTTTLAVNVAAALATERSSQVLMADLHVTGHGDAALLFGVEPRFSIVDALENAHRLDEAFLRGLVVRAKPGVDVLASPDRPSTKQPDSRHVRTLIERLATHYRSVVLDVPRSDFGLFDALETVSSVLLVVNQELPTVRRAAQLAGLLRQRLGKDRVATVVSRYDSRAEIGQDDIERVVGLPVWGVLPSDYRLALSAANQGKPLIAENRSRLANSVRQLARRLIGAEGPETQAARPAPAKLATRLTGLF